MIDTHWVELLLSLPPRLQTLELNFLFPPLLLLQAAVMHLKLIEIDLAELPAGIPIELPFVSRRQLLI